jgi:hypothetical protein
MDQPETVSQTSRPASHNPSWPALVSQLASRLGGEPQTDVGPAGHEAISHLATQPAGGLARHGWVAGQRLAGWVAAWPSGLTGWLASWLAGWPQNWIQKLDPGFERSKFSKWTIQKPIQIYDPKNYTVKLNN